MEDATGMFCHKSSLEGSFVPTLGGEGLCQRQPAGGAWDLPHLLNSGQD